MLIDLYKLKFFEKKSLVVVFIFFWVKNLIFFELSNEFVCSYKFFLDWLMIRIGKSEKEFIEGGIKENIRSDGRKRLDFRSFILNTGV